MARGALQPVMGNYWIGAYVFPFLAYVCMCRMLKLISIILIISILTVSVYPAVAVVFGLVRRDTPFRPRTDRHNNPTAMIWTREREAFFRYRGYAVTKGEPFPDTNRYHTLDMTAVADPVKATIEYIDIYGFYTSYGRKRWEHTAMSLNQWLTLTVKEKRAVIQAMYNKENISNNKIFVSSFIVPKKAKPTRITKVEPSRPRPPARPLIPIIEKPHRRIVLSKTFTDADIDEYGNIKAFAWTDKYRVGDIIEIKSSLPKTAQEIFIYRGPNLTPKWKTTKNGYFRGRIEQVPTGKSYYIWLEKDRDIKVELVITRPA